MYLQNSIVPIIFYFFVYAWHASTKIHRNYKFLFLLSKPYMHLQNSLVHIFLYFSKDIYFHFLKIYALHASTKFHCAYNFLFFFIYALHASTKFHTTYTFIISLSMPYMHLQKSTVLIHFYFYYLCLTCIYKFP